MRSAGVLQLLGVRPGDYGQLINLGLVKFFAGLAESVFFVVAVSLFVGESDMTSYWRVLSISGVAYIIYSFALKRLRLTYPIKLIYSFLSYLNIVILMALTVMYVMFEVEALGIVALIAYFIFSINSNLLSWDLTSTGYNLHGNKELGEGLDLLDILASLLGFMGVPLFVQVLDVQYLFIVVLILVVLYNVFLNRCMKSRLIVIKEREDVDKKKTTRVISKIKFEKKYILLVVLFAMIAATASAVVHFLFLSQVKVQHLSTFNIAVFLGTFYSFGRGTTVIYEMYWYTKRVGKDNVRSQLMSYPIYLFVGGALVFLLYQFVSNQGVLSYALGSLMLLNMILFDGVARRIFIDLLTPLRKERLTDGFNYLKGLGEGGGLFLAGALIFILQDNIQAYLTFILAFAFVWVLILHFGIKEFYQNIIHAFDNRIDGLEHITLTSNTLKSKVDDIILKKDVNDLSFVYSLLSPTSREDVLDRLFDEENESFILFSLSEYQQNPTFKVDKQKVKKLLTHENELIRAYAAELYSSLYDNPRALRYFYKNETDKVREAIVVGLLKSNKIEQITVGGGLLHELLKNKETFEQGIRIVGDVGNPDFYRPLVEAFKSDEKENVKQALYAAVNIHNEKLIPALLVFLGDVKFGKSAVNALEQYGDKAITTLLSQIEDRAGEKLFLLHCIDLCSRIETAQSRRFLKRLLQHKSQAIFYGTLVGLTKINFHTSSKNITNIKSLLKHELDLALYIMQSMFVLDESKKFKNTIHALSDEYKLSQFKIIHLLSFILNKKLAQKSKEAVTLKNDLDRNVFLRELSSQLKSNFYKESVLTILDSSIPLDQKVKTLEAKDHQVMVTEESICDRILYNCNHDFNSWTLASLIKDLGADNIDLEKLQKIDTSIVNQLVEMKETSTLINFDKVQLLRSTDIFSQTPEYALLDLADILEEVKYQDQEVIFNKGDLGYHMYIIYRGKVRIDDLGRELTTFGENDFFGELSLLDPEPRSASAIAQGDVTLFKLDREPFYDMMSNRMEVTKGIMKVLCRRIRLQNENNG